VWIYGLPEDRHTYVFFSSGCMLVFVVFDLVLSCGVITQLTLNRTHSTDPTTEKIVHWILIHQLTYDGSDAAPFTCC